MELSPASRAPGPILVVEDSDEDFRTLEWAMAKLGLEHELVRCEDGADALDYLNARGPYAGGARRPALVLLDLNLPDMSGTDILAKIKSDERLKRTPVVVLTTTDDKVEIQRCYDLGCNVYITKPVNYESFADAIRQLGLFLSVIQVPEVEADR